MRPRVFSTTAMNCTESNSDESKMGKSTLSVIGADLIITGNVASKGAFQLDGKIVGDISCSSLLVGKNAQLLGDATTEDIIVEGCVVGMIRALRVTLGTSSSVEGDIFHRSIVMEQGAHLRGAAIRCTDPFGALPPAQSAKSGGRSQRAQGLVTLNGQAAEDSTAGRRTSETIRKKAEMGAKR